MRRQLNAAAAAAAALLVPVGTAAAAATSHQTKKVKRRVLTITKSVTGTPGSADRWGDVEVTLVIRKTTTIVGTKKTIARKIVDVKVPVYPDHTDRSVFINQQAVPLLIQEELQAQWDIQRLQVIGGATATSYGFGDSLQAALLLAKKV
jgi:uncharacterized protein with FMN-binding domain